MNACQWSCAVLIIAATTTSECPDRTVRDRPSGDRPQIQPEDLAKSAKDWFAEAQRELAETDETTDEWDLEEIAQKLKSSMRPDPTNEAVFVEHAKLKRRIRAKRYSSAADHTLRWLSQNQLEDGGWSFSINNLAPIPDAGDSKSRVEATALALLPFLGAGYTFQDGKYREMVAAGLQFLISEMKVVERRGDLRGQHGDMTTHGVAALVLAEAYGMTNDWQLRATVQAAIRFIEHAQNDDGGWSEVPGGKSDMGVSNWQVMALHSAALSGLDLSPKTIADFRKFLASVQSKDGNYFGRTEAGKDPLGTAVGLLWLVKFNEIPRHDERFRLAAEYLVSNKSRFDDCLTNYVVSMALYQYDGPDGSIWKRCNRQLVETLVSDQFKEGFARGTWFKEEDESAEQGGRLYQTAMNAAALEVYYRYLPVYQQKNVFDRRGKMGGED